VVEHSRPPRVVGFVGWAHGSSLYTGTDRRLSRRNRIKRFIVTGCPRSGTAYAAALFSALGVRCDHERVFGVAQAAGERPVVWDGAEGDSSFLAVPFLPVDGTVVLHQVRHPLEFARSIVGTALLSDHRRDKPFPAAIRRHAPEVYEPARQPERAALMWTIWNTRAEAHADITYRIEDLDVALLVRLCEFLELDVSEDKAAAALDQVPKDTNRRNRWEKVTWARIAPIAADLAAHYGYKAPAAGRAA
jgi:hypothetical protein